VQDFESATDDDLLNTYNDKKMERDDLNSELASIADELNARGLDYSED
jgi:hypothetical protein